MNRLVEELCDELAQVPVIDVHTHLVGGRLGARGLHDIVLYHMAASDLYAAGCPTGARLTEYPGWPTKDEAHARIREALPYFKYVRNTSISWGIRMILADLYDWRDPIDEHNWQKLDDIIRQRADDRAWHRDILRRLNIRRSGTELSRRGGGEDDDALQYALEWAMFTRSRWGEYDTALYELEYTWGKPPGVAPTISAGARPPAERTVQSLADVHDAIEHYVNVIPYDQVLSTATTVSSDLDYRLVSDAEMEAAMARRNQASPAERDAYASYITEAFLTALEKKAGDRTVFQFAFGAEVLPYETGSRLSQKVIGQFAEIIARHPNLRFQCFLASRHANQALCTLCRELPNLSLVGCWWHNFFPSIIRQVLAERLEMLPVNKQIGFFSDAYCLEWVYGKMMIVRRCLAEVLADKIQQGQYTRADAITIAHEILYASPQSLLGFEPAVT